MTVANNSAVELLYLHTELLPVEPQPVVSTVLLPEMARPAAKAMFVGL